MVERANQNRSVGARHHHRNLPLPKEDRIVRDQRQRVPVKPHQPYARLGYIEMIAGPVAGKPGRGRKPPDLELVVEPPKQALIGREIDSLRRDMDGPDIHEISIFDRQPSGQ